MRKRSSFSRVRSDEQRELQRNIDSNRAPDDGELHRSKHNRPDEKTHDVETMAPGLRTAPLRISLAPLFRPSARACTFYARADDCGCRKAGVAGVSAALAFAKKLPAPGSDRVRASGRNTAR